MKPLVYITRRIPSPGVELVEECCSVAVHEGDDPPSRDEIIRNLADKEGILCLITDQINKDVMDAAPRLKVISTMSVGFEHIDVAEATKRGIYVGHTPGVLTEATADLAFSLLLSTARRIPEADRYVRKGYWNKPWSPTLLLGESLWGSTLGIIGLGRIGKAVAKRARGFDMKVLYTDASRAAPEEEAELTVEYRPLEDLLKESDFVTVHTPATKETYHLIDEERLRLMKPSAILINTSRGSMVDEAALAKALKEKWIEAAGLDVFETEPLPAESELWKLENVLLAPHISAATSQYDDRAVALFCENLRRYLRGEPLLNLVDREKGY